MQPITTELKTFTTKSGRKMILAIGDELIHKTISAWTDADGKLQHDAATSIVRIAKFCDHYFEWDHVKTIAIDQNCPNQTEVNLVGSSGGVKYDYADQGHFIPIKPRVEMWDGKVPATTDMLPGPLRIQSTRQAWAWTLHIAELGQSWHPDDNVNDIVWGGDKPKDLKLWQRCMNACRKLLPEVYFAGMLAEDHYGHKDWVEDIDEDEDDTNLKCLEALNKAIR